MGRRQTQERGEKNGESAQREQQGKEDAVAGPATAGARGTRRRATCTTSAGQSGPARRLGLVDAGRLVRQVGPWVPGSRVRGDGERAGGGDGRRLKQRVGRPDNAAGSPNSVIGLSGLGGAVGLVGKIMGGPTGWLSPAGASAAGDTELLGGVSIGTMAELGSGVIAATGAATGDCVPPTVTVAGVSVAALGGAASGDSVEPLFPASLRPVVVGELAGCVAPVSVVAGAGATSTGAGEGSSMTVAGAGSGVGSAEAGSGVGVVAPAPPALPGSVAAGAESAGGAVASADVVVASVVVGDVVGSVAAGPAGVSVVVTSADGSALAVASARALEQKANTSDATRMAKPGRRTRRVGP